MSRPAQRPHRPARPLSPGDSTTSAAASPAATGAVGSSWYVPGIGDPEASVLYVPAGTKNDAIHTRASTAARTVNAVGNLNFRSGRTSAPCAGVVLMNSWRRDRGEVATPLLSRIQSIATAAKAPVVAAAG